MGALALEQAAVTPISSSGREPLARRLRQSVERRVVGPGYARDTLAAERAQARERVREGDARRRGDGVRARDRTLRRNRVKYHVCGLCARGRADLSVGFGQRDTWVGAVSCGLEAVSPVLEGVCSGGATLDHCAVSRAAGVGAASGGNARVYTRATTMQTGSGAVS